MRSGIIIKTVKLLFLLFSLISMLSLAGCWDRIEVNDLALIMAAGLDKPDGKNIELSAQIYVPKASSGGDQSGMMGGKSGGDGQTLVMSANGVTLADATSKLQEKLPRRIFWGHNEIFVFSENVAKEGLREHIDFLLRARGPRENGNIYISKGMAKDILSLLPPLERTSAEVLREMGVSQTGLKVTLKDLAQRMSGDAGASALPRIEILPPEPGTDPKRTVAYINGSVILKKDKMVGSIDDRITRGLLWLRDEIKTATVTISPEEAKGQGHISFKMLRSRTQLIPRIEDDLWSITVKYETEADVMQNTTNLTLNDPELNKKLEVQLGSDIEKRIRAALVRPQKQLNADIFDFADAFRRKYPKEWKTAKDRWDEIFPKIAVHIDAKAKILRTGRVSEKATLPKQEVKKK